ncbi:hypothetical protein [Mucilaginibacter myungsuensis]|uniref:Uncharacterized protein n=1 Tax=Mucilaginibacter myungsuensis TaxID=649104 RepID=A0A929PYY6_9SPHI|nr:hypothetical protein [Mucilaginibacter myungsuensis]MBE9664654.1 hypothetical protein [Mucilaginibacter myungsuensis]MDN3601140.1 hypothetical protein [Mucilaginibacter myungsuensis]
MDGDVIPIKLSSYYGIRKQTYHNAYAGITQAIWEYYTAPKVRYHLSIFDLGLPFDVNGVTINSSGVILRKVLVEWAELRISNYRTYFVLHQDADHNVQQSFNFLKDWDVTALQSLVMTLKKKLDEATT